MVVVERYSSLPFRRFNVLLGLTPFRTPLSPYLETTTLAFHPKPVSTSIVSPLLDPGDGILAIFPFAAHVNKIINPFNRSPLPLRTGSPRAKYTSPGTLIHVNLLVFH